MRARAIAAAVAACLSCATAAQADDAPPENGLPQLTGGIALTTIGVAMAATSPVCETSIVPASGQSSCLRTSFLIAAPLVAFGVPLVVWGVAQHRHYADWARAHPLVAGLSLAPSPRGAGVAWAVRF